MRSKGIDVSEHQGVIDWTKVAKDGVQFAIIRAGYGRELSQKDKQFERNYAGAKAAGIWRRSKGLAARLACTAPPTLSRPSSKQIA